MTIYHLHVRSADGSLAADVEGSSHVDLVMMRHEAIEGARQIIAERIKHSGDADCSDVFEVEDDAGSRVLTLPFTDALWVSTIERQAALCAVPLARQVK